MTLSLSISFTLPTIAPIVALLFSVPATPPDGVATDIDPDALAYESTEVDVSDPSRAATATQLAAAEQLLASGDCASAADVLAALRADNPDDMAVLGMLGSALYECGRVEEALPVLQRALELDPLDPNLLLLLGSARQELDDTEGARESYLRYLVLEPTGTYAEEVRFILERL